MVGAMIDEAVPAEAGTFTRTGGMAAGNVHSRRRERTTRIRGVLTEVRERANRPESTCPHRGGKSVPVARTQPATHTRARDGPHTPSDAYARARRQYRVSVADA